MQNNRETHSPSNIYIGTFSDVSCDFHEFLRVFRLLNLTIRNRHDLTISPNVRNKLYGMDNKKKKKIFISNVIFPLKRLKLKFPLGLQRTAAEFRLKKSKKNIGDHCFIRVPTYLNIYSGTRMWANLCIIYYCISTGFQTTKRQRRSRGYYILRNINAGVTMLVFFLMGGGGSRWFFTFFFFIFGECVIIIGVNGTVKIEEKKINHISYTIDGGKKYELVPNANT